MISDYYIIKIVKNKGGNKIMKNARQIKTELKEKGFDLKGVKIKVENAYNFLWVTVPSLVKYEGIEKALTEITGLKYYEMMIKEF